MIEARQPNAIQDLATAQSSALVALMSQDRGRGTSVSSPQTGKLSCVSVVMGDRHFPLIDIDASGFSVLVPQGSQTPRTGDTMDWSMLVADHAVFTGRASVNRVHTKRSGTAVRFDTLAGQPRRAVLRAHGALADLRGRSCLDASLVPSEYKAACADFVARLRAYRSLADELDDELSSGSAAAQEIFETAARMMASDFREMSTMAGESVTPHLQSLEKVLALRAFTQHLVMPEMAEGAVLRRAFQKPRGYPGDYGVMNYFYDWEDVGETAYARLCHHVGLKFAEFVRTRKDVMREVIRERLARRPELSVTSVACGSAHEIFELASGGSLPNRLHATLVDQDAEALQFATDRLAPYLRIDDAKLTVNAVRTQFGDYSDPNGGALPANQDLVYCFGMFDYLPDKLIAGIVPVLYSKLRPGGTMIVGNVRPAPELIWGLCFLLGYDIWFRTAEEMLAWAAPLARCRAELMLESTGYNYLLFLHRQ